MNHSSSATNGFSPKDTSVFVPEALLSLNQNATNYAVMILNRPVNYPVDFIIPFWNKAAFRITVDGGTNQWLSFLDRNQVPIADVSTIDIVSGDFDSLDRSLLERPDLRNTEIIHTPDQNETDFTKALRELSAHCAKKKTKLNSVFVLCQSSGRMDQVMANINTMYKFLAERMMNDAPIYLLSDNSMSWLLDKGESLIMVPESVLKSKNSWCALIPLGGKCEKITSSGLKWNLNVWVPTQNLSRLLHITTQNLLMILYDSTMEFGKLVSTSNTFDGSCSVRINTSNILLWSMNIIPLFSALYGVSDEES